MRIVSLCPSLTELVFDLGLGERLVGRTRFCVHPAEAVVGVEQVGGTKDPDLARIIALAPDVVLLNEEENRVEDAEALRAGGLLLHVSFPKTAADTAEMVRSIGALLERRDEAEGIAVDIETRAARAAKTAGDVVRWAYLIWRKPWMAVGDGTFAHDLLCLAGGENVFGDAQERYPRVSPEDLARLDPGLVLLCTEPFPFEAAHADELAEATGLPRGRFVIADGEYLSWHGSRTPDGIDYAAGLIAEARGEG